MQVYTDAFDSLMFEWSHGGTLSRSTTNAFEGSKCLDWSYKTVDNDWNKDTLELGLRPTKGTAYYEWYPAKGYTYFQFAIKATNPENISHAEFGFWCMHCQTPGGDGDFHFKERITIDVTTEWQVISKPMSIWATNPLDKISIFTFWFVGKAGATKTDGHIYFDDVKFTNTPVAVRPQASHELYATGQVILPKGGIVRIETFALNGAIVASRKVEIAANTAYRALPNATKNLPAGAYVIRQSVVNGEMVSKLDADRLVVVK
jgi:hypothetical protein